MWRGEGGETAEAADLAVDDDDDDDDDDDSDNDDDLSQEAEPFYAPFSKRSKSKSNHLMVRWLSSSRLGKQQVEL